VKQIEAPERGSGPVYHANPCTFGLSSQLSGPRAFVEGQSFKVSEKERTRPQRRMLPQRLVCDHTQARAKRAAPCLHVMFQRIPSAITDKGDDHRGGSGINE
jgi:hypothetical protein